MTWLQIDAFSTLKINFLQRNPATVIRLEFIQANHLTYEEILDCTGINAKYLKKTLGAKRYLSGADAIILARFFGKPDHYFIRLQAKHQEAEAFQKAAKKINGVRSLGDLKAAVREKNKRYIRRTSSEQSVVNTDAQEPAS